MTGVQTCALPIWNHLGGVAPLAAPCAAQYQNHNPPELLPELSGAAFLGGPEDPHLHFALFDLEPQVLQDGGGCGKQFLFVGRLEDAGLQSPVFQLLRPQLNKVLKFAHCLRTPQQERHAQ